MSRLTVITRPRRDRRIVYAGGAVLLALLMCGLVALLLGRQANSRATMRAHIAAAQQHALAPAIPLPPPDLLRPLTPQEAVVENAKRAAAARPDDAATPFTPKFADEGNRTRAVDCMTQAIYYEAATEPLEGKEAVAQVILNRVHHPAFPSSVCGVVYQGSERTTGCQFTFACDGSLRRSPATALWNAAHKVAIAALAGKVFAPVGHATHYHADYVLPYWADSLDKEIQIGRHIFYRLKGGLGAPHSFNQAYHGQEPAPLTPTDIQVAASAVESATAHNSEEADAIHGALAGVAEAPNPPPLAADLEHGQLLLDESQLAPPPSGPAASPITEPCPAATRLKAQPNDTRLGKVATAACP